MSGWAHRLAARTGAAFSWAGDSLLTVVAIAAPLAGVLLVTGAFAATFRFPWFSMKENAPAYAATLATLAAPLGTGLLFVVGAWLWRHPRSFPFRIAACVALFLVPFAVALFQPRHAVDILLAGTIFGLPFVVAALPVVFPSPRGSIVKLVVGVAILAWAVYLLLLILWAVSVMSPQTDSYSVRNLDGTYTQYDETGLFAGLTAGVSLAGLALGLVWSAYAAAAYLGDGVSGRSMRKPPPRDAGEDALLDDLYVRGLIDRQEREEHVSRRERVKREWEAMAERAWRARSPQRHGVLLLVFGTLGAVVALVGLLAMGVGIAACAQDGACWREARAKASTFFVVPLVGGFALGLAVAALASGTLTLRRMKADDQEAQDRLEALAREARSAKDDLLDLARSRHAERRSG